MNDVLCTGGSTCTCTGGLYVHVQEGLYVHVQEGLYVHVQDGLYVHVQEGLHIHTVCCILPLPKLFCIFCYLYFIITSIVSRSFNDAIKDVQEYFSYGVHTLDQSVQKYYHVRSTPLY